MPVLAEVAAVTGHATKQPVRQPSPDGSRRPQHHPAVKAMRPQTPHSRNPYAHTLKTAAMPLVRGRGLYNGWPTGSWWWGNHHFGGGSTTLTAPVAALTFRQSGTLGTRSCYKKWATVALATERTMTLRHRTQLLSSTGPGMLGVTQLGLAALAPPLSDRAVPTLVAPSAAPEQVLLSGPCTTGHPRASTRHGRARVVPKLALSAQWDSCININMCALAR
jgi:hypothetical protein